MVGDWTLLPLPLFRTYRSRDRYSCECSRFSLFGIKNLSSSPWAYVQTPTVRETDLHKHTGNDIINFTGYKFN